ncbi:MAG: MFS transporter [Firmicutes bacterium]|jgi:hypothetical protein|uniref:Major facilitator superfamily (MFS) profile domain-containing protein n=1 Tax=Sulfobacillus benefaciens TaxID=453960 RepID=A0A2T2X6K7_9FIRM|nr:MFS transporter [Bacillota bacterium]PSR30088.1 MAG: hypothetical protein C7B43_07350 [Sulfobacillus benefaciens]
MNPDGSPQHTTSTTWRSRNVWGFSLASLFSDMGHELVTTVLPAFLLTIGAPVFALAVIEGVSNFSQSLASLWGGKWADNRKSRERIVVAGYVMTGIKAVIALVTYWPWIVVLRTVAWIGRGARGPIRDTMIADEISPENRGKAYGFRETFDTAGAIVGPLAATLLITVISPGTLIALSAIPAIITVVIIAGMVREIRGPVLDKNPAPGAGPGEVQTVWSRSYRVFRGGVVIFWFGAISPTFFIMRILLTHPRGLAFPLQAFAFGLYTIHNIFYAASSYPAGILADHGRAKGATLSGYGMWVLSLVGFFALPFLPIWLWPLLFIFSGLATGLIETGQKTLAVGLLPPVMRGKGLGQIAGMKGFSQLAGTLLMGGLWTLHRPGLGFLCLALAALAGWLIIWAVPSMPKPVS